MDMLLAAASVFLALHLLVAGTPVRQGLVGMLGEGLYLGAFSLASIAAIVWLVMAYNAAFTSETYAVWDFGPGVRHMGLPVLLLAFLLAVPGLLTPSPTAIGQAKLLEASEPVQGMLRITRHPFLWGTAIWAAFHLLANGDAASIIFFGTFLILTVLGTLSIDAKRRRNFGQSWSRFAARSSNIPFAAILTGRTRFSLSEIGLWRLALALLAFLAALLAHAWLFNASPFPGGWVPFS